MIIGLGHKARVGKDTVGDILVAKHGFTKISFAAALKDMALAIDPVIFAPGAVNIGVGHGRLRHLVVTEGWENAKRHTEVRRFLQELGVAARAIFGEGVWIEKALGFLDTTAGNFVVTDVRFPNEANTLLVDGGKLVRVDRPSQPALPGLQHVSETALDGFNGWDYVLINNGSIAQLEAKVEDMLISLHNLDIKTAEAIKRGIEQAHNGETTPYVAPEDEQ